MSYPRGPRHATPEGELNSVEAREISSRAAAVSLDITRMLGGDIYSEPVSEIIALLQRARDVANEVAADDAL